MAKVKYSVLLLYPDYCSDAYGQETYFAHVQAPTPGEALEAARKKCMAEELAPEINDPDDLFCLLIVHGHLNDLSSVAQEA